MRSLANIVTKQQQQKNKPWVSADILDLCDKRRGLRKKKFKLKESETYKQMNNSIMRCIKRQKKTG